MDKPCKYCDKSIHKNVGNLEQQCNETCESFEIYVERLTLGIDKLLLRGKQILKKYNIEL